MAIEHIKTDDLIAVPENLSVFGNLEIPDEEIKLLAYIIGDGGCSQNTVRFSQKPSPQLDEYIKCTEFIGCRLVKLNDYDYIAYGEGRGNGKKGSNPMLNLYQKYGLQGKTAHFKSIPDEVFQMPEEKLKIFLSRLFSTDGWTSSAKNGCREIGYCSASEQLIQDVSHLLLRFGVHCRINWKTKVKAWTLTINHSYDQIKFINEIGIFGKEPAINAIALVAEKHCSRRIIQHKARPDRPRWIHKNAHPNTRWEKVIAVNYLGEKPTVGVEVPVYDTYLTDFYEHNTKSSSGILNWFLDCFIPSAIFTFAPGGDQARFAMWSEIRKDREGKGLPGRVLETEIKISGYHLPRTVLYQTVSAKVKNALRENTKLINYL